MKKAGLIAMALGFALVMPGCGFTEGTDAIVTVIEATPTPIPTATPEPVATPTPEATPTPAVVTEQTASGVTVTVQSGIYTTTAEINIRSDASTDADVIMSVASGTQLTSTGVCDNNWIRVDYEGQTGYVSGDYVTKAAEDASGDTAAETAADGTEAVQ